MAQGKLSFSAPDAGTTKYDEYVSDPAKPVPFSPRLFYEADEDAWRTWLVRDQRFVDGRQDVLTYETDPLSKPIRVSGRPEVNVVASTSGTDSDWVFWSAWTALAPPWSKARFDQVGSDSRKINWLRLLIRGFCHGTFCVQRLETGLSSLSR